MSTQEQVRALMVRHQHVVKNRSQSMLSRAAVEVGMPAEAATHQSTSNPSLS